MKLLQKILVATELGQSQTDTVRTAETVARTFGSEVFLVHVIPEIRGSPLDLPAQKTTADARLQDLRAEISGGGVRVAEQHGESPFRWGLTAEKLMRKAFGRLTASWLTSTFTTSAGARTSATAGRMSRSSRWPASKARTSW